MEIKEVEEPIRKVVEVGYKKVTTYVAKDGRVFTIKRDAELYEQRLAIEETYQAIPRIETNSVETSDFWYYISNEEEMQLLIGRFLHYKDNLRIYGGKDYPCWYTYQYNDGGDYEDDMVMYTWDFIKKQMEDIMAQMNNVINKT